MGSGGGNALKHRQKLARGGFDHTCHSVTGKILLANRPGHGHRPGPPPFARIPGFHRHPLVVDLALGVGGPLVVEITLQGAVAKFEEVAGPQAATGSLLQPLGAGSHHIRVPGPIGSSVGALGHANRVGSLGGARPGKSVFPVAIKQQTGSGLDQMSIAQTDIRSAPADRCGILPGGSAVPALTENDLSSCPIRFCSRGQESPILQDYAPFRATCPVGQKLPMRNGPGRSRRRGGCGRTNGGIF